MPNNLEYPFLADDFDAVCSLLILNRLLTPLLLPLHEIIRVLKPQLIVPSPTLPRFAVMPFPPASLSICSVSIHKRSTGVLRQSASNLSPLMHLLTRIESVEMFTKAATLSSQEYVSLCSDPKQLMDIELLELMGNSTMEHLNDQYLMDGFKVVFPEENGNMAGASVVPKFADFSWNHAYVVIYAFATRKFVISASHEPPVNLPLLEKKPRVGSDESYAEEE